MLKLVFIKVKKNLKGLFKIIKNIYIIYELHSTIDGDLCWSEDFGKYDLKLNVLKHGEEGTADGSFTDWRLCCTSVSVCFSSWSGKKFRETAEGNLWHGLLYIWTELLYLTCPHEAALLTLIMSHKLTQSF